MNIRKALFASLLMPALVAPSIASAAVRPAMKPVVASTQKDRSVVVRSSLRTGAKLEGENQVFLVGLPLLLIAAAVAAVVATVVVVTDDETSPG